MTIQELNSQLTQALKNYIKTSKHYKTGSLYNSINFLCTDVGGLKIKFKTNDYITELENGDFVSSFFELNSTIDIITEYLSGVIIEITPTKKTS